MPLDRRGTIQLTFLLLCVPMQYLITRYIGNSEDQRSEQLQKLVLDSSSFFKSYLKFESWTLGWLRKPFRSLFQNNNQQGADDGESPAIEVMKYRNKEGYFAGSPEPRTHRLEDTQFRVGQIVQHKLWGYKGVIIGWDETAKAPEEWIEIMHPNDKLHWRLMPNYAILVDTRDRSVPQTTYVPQENLVLLKQTKIQHPSLSEYFEIYDGTKYIPRKWLKAIYPED